MLELAVANLQDEQVWTMKQKQPVSDWLLRVSRRWASQLNVMGLLETLM
jgi:hypothetical protein